MKYEKGDCRIGRNAPCFTGQHAMTIGPRATQMKAMFGTRTDPAYEIGPSPFRHERRQIGAAYRAKYGKADFLAMRGRIGSRSSRDVAAAMLARFEADKKDQAEGR